MRRLLAVLFAFAPPAGATAQTAQSSGESSLLSGLALTLATDHRSKGASKTGGRAQAELEYGRDLPRDLRLGLRATNLRNTAGSDAQIDLSLAWRPTAGGIAWKLELKREHYPGSDTDGNTAVWQIGAEAGREWGRFDAALLMQHQPDGFAVTGANTYLAAEGGARLRPDLRAVAGLGRREQQDSVDYTAWNAGLVMDVSGRAAFDVRWYATDQDDEGPNYRDRLVAALTLAF